MATLPTLVTERFDPVTSFKRTQGGETAAGSRLSRDRQHLCWDRCSVLRWKLPVEATVFPQRRGHHAMVTAAVCSAGQGRVGAARAGGPVLLPRRLPAAVLGPRAAAAQVPCGHSQGRDEKVGGQPPRALSLWWRKLCFVRVSRVRMEPRDSGGCRELSQCPLPAGGHTCVPRRAPQAVLSMASPGLCATLGPSLYPQGPASTGSGH